MKTYSNVIGIVSSVLMLTLFSTSVSASTPSDTIYKKVTTVKVYSERDRAAKEAKEIKSNIYNTSKDMYYVMIGAPDWNRDGQFFTAHSSGFGVSLIKLPKFSGDPELSDAIDFGRSIRYSWGFFDSKYRVGGLPLSFVTGFGIEFNSIHFKNRLYVGMKDDKMKVMKADPDKLNNSRLHVTYLTLPILFEYAFGNVYSHGSRQASPFFVNLGVVAKYRTAESSKTWWKNEGRRIEARRPGFNPLALDLIAQVGKGSWGFVTTYSPFSVMQSEQTYQTGMLTFGFKFYFSQQ